MWCFRKATTRVTIIKSKAHRLLALAVCILFITVSLLSATYIFTHTDHEHDHNGRNGTCATCAQLTSSSKLLNLFLTAFVKIAAIDFNLFAVLSLLWFSVKFIDLSSLVALKVQLNI